MILSSHMTPGARVIDPNLCLVDGNESSGVIIVRQRLTDNAWLGVHVRTGNEIQMTSLDLQRLKAVRKQPEVDLDLLPLVGSKVAITMRSSTVLRGLLEHVDTRPLQFGENKGCIPTALLVDGDRINLTDIDAVKQLSAD